MCTTVSCSHSSWRTLVLVLDELIDQLGNEIAERVRPVEHVVARVDGIPGFGRRTAEIVIAEIGTDLSRFPSCKHLASWVGVCPGNNESAGKRMSGKTGYP